MDIVPSTIVDCHRLNFGARRDARGCLVKPYRSSEFERAGLDARFVECFYTISGANVLRGMHFQLPPAGHAKLVYCIRGKVLDVWLDARRGSPTFGRWDRAELDGEEGTGVYLASGVAHGFCVLEAPSVIAYHVTSEYAPKLEAGIAWDSFGAPWPVRSPVVSERDAKLPRWEAFDSPFRYSSRNPGAQTAV